MIPTISSPIIAKEEDEGKGIVASLVFGFLSTVFAPVPRPFGNTSGLSPLLGADFALAAAAGISEGATGIEAVVHVCLDVACAARSTFLEALASTERITFFDETVACALILDDAVGRVPNGAGAPPSRTLTVARPASRRAACAFTNEDTVGIGGFLVPSRLRPEAAAATIVAEGMVLLVGLNEPALDANVCLVTASFCFVEALLDCPEVEVVDPAPLFAAAAVFSFITAWARAACDLVGWVMEFLTVRLGTKPTG